MDEDDRISVAWNAVNALIEDAKCNLRGERGEIFAWAIYNAVRHTGDSQLQNLRELLREHRLTSTPPPGGERSWVA